MALLELNNLANKIDGLLRAYQAVRHENILLREQLAQQVLQEQNLVAKNLKVTGQVKRIINQLREEVHE